MAFDQVCKWVTFVEVCRYGIDYALFYLDLIRELINQDTCLLKEEKQEMQANNGDGGDGIIDNENQRSLNLECLKSGNI